MLKQLSKEKFYSIERKDRIYTFADNSLKNGDIINPLYGDLNSYTNNNS